MCVIGSEVQTFNLGYRKSGSPVFMWARMQRSVVIFRSQKRAQTKKVLETLL